jgi:hypothetical protein
MQILKVLAAAALVAGAAASPAAAQQANSRSPDRTANGCLSMSRSGYGDTLIRNSCPFAVNFAFCWREATPGSPGSRFRCETQAFSSASVDRGGQARVAHSSRGTIQLAACQAPQTPIGMRRGLFGASHQCQ